MRSLRISLLATLLLLALTPAASAANLEERRALSDTILAPWPAMQDGEGSFYDNVTGKRGRAGGYAEAMMGYAFLQRGLASGNQEQISAGLRAIAFVAGHPEFLLNGNQGVFENMAMASAYNLANTYLQGDARMERIRPGWEAWLRGITPVYLNGSERFANKYVVEAIAWLELQRSGLSSGVENAVLARPEIIQPYIAGMMRGLSKVSSGNSFYDGSGHAYSMFSDPPKHHLVYHALTAGMLSRLISLQGGALAPRASKEALSRMVKASTLLVSPDGSVGYHGRSQEEGWGLSSTAYAAEAAISLHPSRPDLTGPERALSELVLTRLQNNYIGGPDGLYLIPAMRTDYQDGKQGLDGYASAGGYVSLALVHLHWALDQYQQNGEIAPTKLGFQHSRGWKFSSGSSQFATLRKGNVWIAVKRAFSGDEKEAGDLRYDFGLMAFKLRKQGEWANAIPIRPFGQRYSRRDSLGPLLVVGKRLAYPRGTTLTIRGKSIIIGGVYETAGGKVIRSRVSWSYTIAGEQVRLRINTRPGDKYVFGNLRAGSYRPLVTVGGSFSRGGQSVQAASASDVSAGTSGEQIRVRREQIVLRSGKNGSTSGTVTISPRG